MIVRAAHENGIVVSLRRGAATSQGQRVVATPRAAWHLTIGEL